MPAWCAAASGDRIATPSSQASSIASGPADLSRLASDSPSRNSMTRNGSPRSLVPRSVTWAMPSWPICDAVIASRWNRSIIIALLSSGFSTLIATRLCSRTCVPR
jgi:hypothetical protein